MVSKLSQNLNYLGELLLYSVNYVYTNMVIAQTICSINGLNKIYAWSFIFN